jgi:hypothetical protein
MPQLACNTAPSRRSALPLSLLARPHAVAPLNADAELLALAPAFDRLYRQWVRLQTAENTARLRYEAAVERQTGIAYLDAPDVKTNPGYWRKRRSIAAAMHYEETSFDEFERDPIIDDILSHKASTRDGLALQVRAMILQRHEAWVPTICWQGEAEDPAFKDFLASVAGFAGVQFPPFRPFLDTLRTQRQQAE